MYSRELLAVFHFGDRPRFAGVYWNPHFSRALVDCGLLLVGCSLLPFVGLDLEHDFLAGLGDQGGAIAQDVVPLLFPQLLQVLFDILLAQLSIAVGVDLEPAANAFCGKVLPFLEAEHAFAAVVEPEAVEVGEVAFVVELASGPLCPLDLAVVAEAAVVDGDEVHPLHVADRQDGPDGLVDPQDLPRVLGPVVLRRERGELVAGCALGREGLFLHANSTIVSHYYG